MKKKFSLIEIAISLAVAFLAITVLIAFFPTSFQRMKNSQDRTYATNAIAHFVSYLKNDLIEQPAPDKYYVTAGTYNSEYTDYLKTWDDNVAVTGSGATNPLPETRLPDENFITTDLLKSADFTSVGNSDSEGTYILQNSSNKSIYLIRNFTKVNGVNIPDQIIAARVWKSTYISATLLTPQTNVETVYQADSDYSQGVRVNIEFSWPITKAPAERETINTFFDVVKF